MTCEKTQIERELEFRNSAIVKYREDQDSKLPSATAAGAQICDTESRVQLIAAAIEDMVARVEEGRTGGGNPGTAVQYLRMLQPWPVAILTMRVGFDAGVKRLTLSRAAMRLASAINDQYQFDLLEQEAKGLVIHLEKTHKHRAAGARKASIIRHAASYVGVPDLDWSDADKLKVGGKLIEIMIAETQLIVNEHVRTQKNRSTQTLRLTPATEDWYTDTNLQAADLLASDLRVTIIPPKPWTTPLDGGYYSRELRRDLMRKTWDSSRDDLFSTDLRKVYDAVNSIQDTPWTLNTAVHDVLLECHRAGTGIGGLPCADPEPLPPRPAHIPEDMRIADMPENWAEEMKAWKRTVGKVHDANHLLQSQRLALVQKIHCADELRDHDEFYFPHNLDFRGRIYPLPPVINPQSDDIGKSLLMFAEGRPLGESGAYWLAVHIANLFGIDKVSFDERVKWTNDNTDALMDSAFNPLDGERFWTEADDPWQALAACFEWAGACVQGAGYVSQLPIAMDGSCSGIQHFSAMLRDDEAAAAVNLKKNDKPADIYTQVAERTEKFLLEDDSPLSRSWRGNVTRKIVKRPCMTFAYSVTSRGIIQQILDEMRKTGEGILPGWDNMEAAVFLGPVVQRAICDTVKRAAEAMDWLKVAARLLTDNNTPIVWYTPVGLPIIQFKRKYTSKKHWLWVMGERLRLSLRTPSKKVDPAKQQSSIAPNFVHSMDAAHLMMVANRMVAEEVTGSFAMIHDSFGVHACDVDELHFVIRDEFINMYSVDRLMQFKLSVQSRLKEAQRDEVPDPPEAGDYDIEEVRDADFFFA
jgi:DNA-directed RNA polymerase